MTQRNPANAAIGAVIIWILVLALWLGHFAWTGDPLPHWSSAFIPAVGMEPARG